MDTINKILQGRLSGVSRTLILVASLALLPCIFLPTWRITLAAPQYPDGLALTIYPTTVQGDLREVNLLNHYIGMREIAPDEFSEFRFIPFFILRFLGLALLAGIAGQMTIAVLGYLDFMIFGVVMLSTLQHWLSEFGQNLSPTAPLSLEPFSAKFLGLTQIGQFSVASAPALGAIFMGLAGAIGPVVLFLEWRRHRTSTT